ncbi:MAG: hypothetical protein L3J92_05640 [Thermoplasmata archaeon]|jgi:hypothetical protein|nr:hypothetical protein [Thermoplasmata archaeon]
MVLLQSGETPLKSGSAVVQTQAGPRPGIFTVTNMALVLETTGAPPPPGDGWGPPTAGTTNEYRIGLWRVRQAQAVQGPGGAILQINLMKRVLMIQTDDLPAWVAVVGEAQAHAPAPPPEVAERRALKKGGVAPPRRCSYCTQLSPPGSIKCVSCGASF